jgi:parvulin-like peptidyl-prolyl isomerase
MIFPELSGKDIDKGKFLSKLIDEELILREAQKLDLHEKEDYKNKVEAFKKDLLVDLYLQQYLREKNTEENQQKYYEEKKEKYTSPEMVRISVILVKTVYEAKEILKKTQEGEDFAEMAREYSKDPSAGKGGDFGFHAKKALRKEFADIAFSMKTGEISNPIRTGDGCFIIKVTDYQEERVATFEEIKPKIASEYVNKILTERILELRKAVNIRTASAGLNNPKIE